MENVNYLREAKILFASGQLEQCIDKFSAAEAEGCSVVVACLSRGAALVALGRFKEAEEDFSRVLTEDENNERAYYFRGITRVALGNYNAAMKDLTQSLIRNHDRGIAYLVRGLAYSELGKDTDAVLDFNSSSHFSSAEFKSFKNVFGKAVSPFQQTKTRLAEEDAPWNNVLTEDAADRLRRIIL